MALQLYEPTKEEDASLTNEEYYKINKDKLSKDDQFFLESKFVFESNGNKQETPAFITKQGYLVVEDWDMLMSAFEGPYGSKLYAAVGEFEAPVFLGLDMLEQTSCILVYHPQVEYEPHIKNMVDKLKAEGHMSDFENYNTIDKKKDTTPKLK